MKILQTARKEPVVSIVSARKGLWLPILIFGATLAAYYISNSSPIRWYDHHLYLAKAILNGTLDVGSVGIPDFYQDTVTVDGSKYLPFGPAPALIMVPFVAIWGLDFSQIYFSMVLGATNVVLFWYLLGLLRISRTTKLLIVPFFALGTVHFYSATTGTVWFYNHIAATFFMLLAIIALVQRMPLWLVGVALGFSYLSRGPTLMAFPFFLYYIFRQDHERPTVHGLLSRRTLLHLGSFAVGLAPFGLFTIWYNVVRFGGAFDTGFQTVYESYTNSGVAYSYYRTQFPSAEHFALFDVRNIPLHLHVLFMMPPEFHPDWSVFRPSPYGLSILFTSPAFAYAFLVRRKDALVPASWTAIGLISIPLFLHYSQGWVQYGYRFLLDFAPFLLILTAFGFDDNTSPTSRKVQIALVALSIVAGFWGRHWGNELGW